MTSILRSRGVEVGRRVKYIAQASAYSTEGKSQVVLQVNCRSVCNEAVELWNLIDTYNTDVVTDTESWLKEVTINDDVFRADFTTFRRDRFAPTELWVVDDFEMMAVEVKGTDPKYT